MIRETRCHLPDVGCDHLQAVTRVSKGDHARPSKANYGGGIRI